MTDVSVIRFRDVLDVNGIDNAPGVTPRSVIVSGDDFRSVEQVLLNGIPAPAFVQYLSNKLLVEVPESIRNDVIRSAMVLSSAITLTPERSMIEMTLGLSVRPVGGIQKLVQNFTRLLLRTCGTNIFHPRLGGSLQKRVGGVVGGSGRDRVIGDAVVAIGQVRQQMQAEQASNTGIPPSERLLGAEVIGVEYDMQSGTLLMQVVLTNHTGLRGAATLAV